MLSVKTNKGYIPLENRQNLSIRTEFGGNYTLSFDISTKDDAYKHIQNQSLLKYNDNEYLVDSINQRKVISTVTASINMDDWKVDFHHTWDSAYDLFADVLLKITPQGWTMEDAGTVTGRKALHLEGVTDYEILMNCKNLYNIAFEFHTTEKRIKVLKPDTYQSRGLYATEELNATNVEYKGASTTFATRLYAYGKKEETKDEEGNVVTTTYVNFAGINGGKEYVENVSYSSKIITAYWSDERYTSAEDLLVDAKEKLKALATPVSSYSFDLIDLSRVNNKYKMLDFHMYDKITLMVNGERIEHQIVEYTEYPDSSNNNKVVLSTAFKKITGKIEGISQQITNIDIDLNKKENIINEVRRDVESNTARIKNTYTKGEVDHIEQSIIQQTTESIDLSIAKVEESVDGLDQRLSNAEQQITPEQITNTVSSSFYKKDEIDNKYTSKEEMSSEVKQLKDSIDLTLKEMSGFNFLYNSSGWNSTNFWYGEKKEDGSLTPVIGRIDGIKNNDTTDNTISESAFYFEDGLMRQDVRLTPDNKYTISLKMKRYIGESYLKVVQNDIVLTVFSFDKVYTDEEWHTFTATFKCLSSIVTIEVKGVKTTIADIMLNDGEIEKTWSSNNDEIYTAGVKIDKDGIRISQSDTNTETIIDSTEFAVIDKKTKKSSVRVNGDTTVLEKVQVKSTLQIGNLMAIPRVNGLDIAFIKE